MAYSSGRKWAFLSNGLTSAIEAEGSIDWFPAPRFDSPSIFSKILDESKGGHFSVRPESAYSLKSSYVGDSLILENSFSTPQGSLEVKDFLPLGVSGIARTYRSEVPFIVEIKPLFGYGLTKPDIGKVPSGLVFRNQSSQEGLEVSITGRHKIIDDGVVRVQPGEGTIFALYSKDLRYGLFSNKGLVSTDQPDALGKAAEYWRVQVALAKGCKEYRDAYDRSIAVVLGLTYLPSGAIIAAPTASLPEAIGASRNWDYRYLWVRDASYAAEALASVGYPARARRILDFMLSVMEPSSKPFGHPLYSIDGMPPPPEETMGWLDGHMASRPVRVGNAAYMQVQMDVEGAFIDALYTYLRLSKDASYAAESWWAIESIADWTARSWEKVSTSLWEQRSKPRHFVHTKVMEWVAVDRASMIAEMVGQRKKAREWRALAAKMRTAILRDGFSKSLGSFVQYYGAREVDASLLCLPLYGFIDASDRRFKATLKRIEKELMVEEGLLFRYRSDFLGAVAHPFTLPSTWLARVYLRLGERAQAEAVIRKLVSCSTEHLLLGEHVELKTLEPRGNFPQLFPHAGLLIALAEYDDPGLYSH